MSWGPKSTKAPPYIALAGNLLQAGRIVEPDALPPATLQAPPRQRDHWQRLSNLSVKRGWARLLDFASVFEMGGLSGRKQAGHRVTKRLLDKGCEVEDGVTGVGKPSKIARITDFKSLLPSC